MEKGRYSFERSKDGIFNVVLKTSSNLNSDPMDMLVQCLRLGISTEVYGLVLVNHRNNNLMGMWVIAPECINIMVTGHQNSLFEGLTELVERLDIKIMAEKTGDRGIRIAGCTYLVKTGAMIDKKTMVLPESMDRRTWKATKKRLKKDIADLIIIGTPEDMADHNKGARCIRNNSDQSSDISKDSGVY